MDFGVCSNRHCQVANREALTWIIDGIEYRFKELVTYNKAVDLKKTGSKLVFRQPPPIRENKNKIWLNSPTR